MYTKTLSHKSTKEFYKKSYKKFGGLVSLSLCVAAKKYFSDALLDQFKIYSFAFNAFNTRSGVKGNSSKRIPIASSTAEINAGA